VPDGLVGLPGGTEPCGVSLLAGGVAGAGGVGVDGGVALSGGGSDGGGSEPAGCGAPDGASSPSPRGWRVSDWSASALLQLSVVNAPSCAISRVAVPNSQRPKTSSPSQARGKRSQVAFARRLGYRGNPIADWESGRRWPTAQRALHACSVAGIGAREASRHQISRWLSAEAAPRLPEFLRLVEAMTGRISDLIAELVPIDGVPCLAEMHTRREAARRLAYEEPWTEAILRVLEIADYRALPEHVPGFIGERLGIELETETRCLAKLLHAGVIRRVGAHYLTVGSLTVDTRSVSRLKAHWTEAALARLLDPGADDLFSYNVFSASSADLVRIRELLRATYREIRSLISATDADESVALINLQFLQWPREPPREPVEAAR
jgi:hypothetical protein